MHWNIGVNPNVVEYTYLAYLKQKKKLMQPAVELGTERVSVALAFTSSQNSKVIASKLRGRLKESAASAALWTGSALTASTCEEHESIISNKNESEG